jgi:hypothetical protein
LAIFKGIGKPSQIPKYLPLAKRRKGRIVQHLAAKMG